MGKVIDDFITIVPALDETTINKLIFTINNNINSGFYYYNFDYHWEPLVKESEGPFEITPLYGG